MAEIVGIYAASHTPVMLNFPDLITSEQLGRVRDGFAEMGKRIAAAKPDLMVVISDDHLHNFFLNNLPAFAIGAGEAYQTPIEPWLKAEKRMLPGDSRLGAHLVGEAMEAGFDPSLCMELILDHGTLTPLEMAGIAREVPIVPVLVNCTQPPFPTMKRCYQFGQFLGQALKDYRGVERIAVLGTGGLSHDVGTPRMGMVNAEFDKRFLELLKAGEPEALCAYARDHVNEAGNGTEEVRMWILAQGVAAAEGRAMDIIHYEGLEDWYCGIGLAEWKEAA